MQQILEFLPLVAFLAAYYLGDFYIATGALMASMVVLLAIDYLRERRIPAMHGISAALVFLFGGATLILHDQRFIQWKPTVFFWLLALAFLLSRWIGKQPLVERLLGAALGPDVRIERADWQRLNLVWVVFYAVLGVANLAVAWNTSEQVWVNFKVFGLTAVTFVFIGLQMPWLLKRARSEATPS